ncbi:MAG: DUF87 domain-containing protein [Oscillospiraceae bacterium]|nr:DUF87 domain-containing protein [Oscillospiraceae bacterium]
MNDSVTVTNLSESTTTIMTESEEIFSNTTVPDTGESTEFSDIVSGITAEQDMDFSETEAEISERAETESTGEYVSEQSEIVTSPILIEADITDTGSETVVSSEIVTLPIETTAAETTILTTASVPISAPSPFRIDNISIDPSIIFAIVIFAAIVIYAFIIKKNNHNKDISVGKDPKNAKERDRIRLEEQKAINKSKAKREKLKSGKAKRIKISKTVADTIPYKKILDKDIWLLADQTYSKVYAVEDINYNLGDDIQQNEMLENYCTFLNTLDDTAECQISVLNSEINIREFENKILVKPSHDGYDDIRTEYNEKVLRENLSKGQNAIRKKIYITITIKAPDGEAARRKFNTIDLETKNSFDRIGNTQLRPLSNQERIEMLKDIFIGVDTPIPTLTKEEIENGLDKVYCAPDYFEFKSDYFMFGEYYAKCVFIKEYPTTANDNILNDLMGSDIQLLVTTNVFAYDTAEARKLVQRQITAVETNMAQRESAAAKAGNFSSTMPVKVRNQVESYKALYDMITTEDQKLYKVSTIIMVKATTYDDLKSNMEVVASALKRNGCMYSEMKWQQEDGMCDVLPIGTQRKFEWNRSLPTESVGIFVPFNVKEVQQAGGIYYGLNKLSNNIITFQRTKSLINPAGYLLGNSGSGKSFAAKREMVSVFLTDPRADIIIIDPEREYPSIVNMFGGASIKISTGSKSYVNPFDFDLELLNDDDVDVIADKCQLIESFISVMNPNRPLSPQEVSFIDRCVNNTYLKSNFLKTLDKNDIPTLGDFYEVMKTETENVDPKVKQDLLITLEMYVKGSAKYFNNRTNIDVNNRLISYDIKDLTGILKTQAMLLVLDNVWNRLSANRNKGVPTWIYIDEIHVLFRDSYCLSFIRDLYKRARKYGGILTGITQNVEDLLRDDDCRTMLANSEFLILLKQSASDSLKLQDTLHFTDSELLYVNNIGAGEGLIVLGGKDKIPFYDRFPKDTMLYKAMSTSFSETQAIMEKKQ